MKSGFVGNHRHFSSVNPFGIRLLNPKLSQNLFDEDNAKDDKEKIEAGLTHLAGFNIKPKSSESELKLDDFKLPDFYGNIETHFYKIGQDYIQPYLYLLEALVADKQDHKCPTKWVLDEAGWTRYDHRTGEVSRVAAPTENCFTFDVEVCVKEGHYPVIAAALSSSAWYSWISPNLLTPKKSELTPEDLIPVDGSGERVVIGHNVSYDRARCREQYDLESTPTRFLDTMSLHIAVSGMTSGQRSLKSKSNSSDSTEEMPGWVAHTSMNNLQDVYQLYCGPDVAPLKKAKRDVFVHGTMDDVRQDLAELMTYCANDVLATHRVTQKLFPLFRSRCPHPVTFAGMLEMGLAYLPTNSNWTHYVRQADDAADELEAETLRILAQHAKEACQLLPAHAYTKDLWMWDQEWQTKNLKVKKSKNAAEKKVDPDAKTLEDKFKGVMETKKNLYKLQPVLPGYPAWYVALCTKSHKDGFAEPTELSASKTIVPKLLRLCWKGSPLHRDDKEKWGYISLDPANLDCQPYACDEKAFPTEIFRKFLNSGGEDYDPIEDDDDLDLHYELRDEPKDTAPLTASKPKKRTEDQTEFRFPNIPGCVFTRLPHKDGKENRVGNPLSKNFLDKVRDGVLAAQWDEGSAERVLRAGKTLSYWKSNHDRIKGQMVVAHPSKDDFSVIIPQVVPAGTLTRRAVERTWLTASNAKPDRIGSELKSMIQAPPGYSFVGADVDSQELWIAAVIGDSHFTGHHGSTALGWMTLQGSKAQGTDMHSVVAKSVGVSRDQAKILNYGRIYGAGVPFAKQLLMSFNPNLSDEQASKLADKMYSETKGNRTYILNKLGAFCYSLLPEKFAESYLSYVGWTVTRREMSHIVKVKRKLDVYTKYDPKKPMEFELNDEGETVAYELGMDMDTFQREDRLSGLGDLIRSISSRPGLSSPGAWAKDTNALSKKCIWEGGTESHTFNRLEEIALAWKAKTPVLGARISRVLESDKVGIDYLPSRINWVVQSSAVDYLHLLLVAMRWQLHLQGIGDKGRFVISIHDEVRYMVPSEHKYKAALALQTANLMVRAMFCSRLGMKGLPEDVAFFSSVDVDNVVRKEPDMECTTPSNPQGLTHGYGLSVGESLTIKDVLKNQSC